MQRTWASLVGFLSAKIIPQNRDFSDLNPTVNIWAYLNIYFVTIETMLSLWYQNGLGYEVRRPGHPEETWLCWL